MATIQGVYVALFGRPADPTGLAYFNSVTKSGADLSGIGDLASTQEYKDRFAGQSNLAIVNSIYQSLFNRDAESTGLNFFVDALNKGTFNIKNIAIAILDGAQGNDKTVATNKIAAADNFTKAIDTPVEIAAYTGNTAAAAGRAFLQPVNASPSSIPTSAATDAALLTLTSTSTGGVSLSLKDADTLTLSTTSAVAATKTSNGDDTITVTDEYKGVAKIDAGFGTDTVVLKNLATALDNTKILATSFANVEKLFVTSTADTAALDLTNATTLKQVWADGTDVATANLKAVAFTNIATGATLGVKAGATTASFTFKDTQSGTTNLALDKAAVGTTLEVKNGSDTVAISVANGASVTGFKDADVKTLILSGSGDVTKFTIDAATAKLATVDASALNGKIALDLTGATVGSKVTGSNFADDIKLSAAGKADTLVYNKAEASTYASFEKVTNFTTVEDKIDIKAFALTKTAGITTLNNLVENASYGTNAVAQYTDGTNTFVFVDSNNDGKINLASDFAVQLTGHAAADLTTSNLIFA